MLRLRVRTVVFIGFISSALIAIAPLTAAYSQGEIPFQPEKKEAPTAKNTPAEKPVDPKAATTTQEVKIPLDELKALVKPLTLSELQVEVAGWMQVLQSKAKEISAAEVTIKWQNTAIDKQQEGADSLEKAKQALEAAEKTQRGAAPGSPQYQEATKKLEEAKENLKKAQDLVEKARQTKAEIQQDKTSRKALEKAQETNTLDTAKQALEKLKASREKLDASSPAYAKETQTIDRLTEAISALEKAQEAQKNAKPDSPEAATASKLVDQASTQLEQILRQIGAASSTQTPAQPSSSRNLNQAAATLENTTIKSNLEEKVAAKKGTATTGTPEMGEKQNLQQKQQQLEKTTENLQKSAEVEAETKNKLVSTVTELQSQLTAIADRLTVVLDELDRKGGDSKPYRQYLKVVNTIEVDAKDTQGMGVRLLAWLGSEEGGLRWAANLGKFAGILLVSILASQMLGFIVGQSLRRLDRRTSTVLHQFIVTTITRGGVLIGLLLALTALEVSLGPVLALLGGVSFVLAFALQSNLGNFASGLMIMLNKPFDVGDEIKLGNLWGWVHDITLANTKIKGFDGQMFSVPNNQVWGDTIENLTHDKIRRITIMLRVSFEEDLNRVQQLMLDIMNTNPQVEKKPAASTSLWRIEEYYISMYCSAWVKTEIFWHVYEQLMYETKERFDQEGVQLAAIPRTDINLYQRSKLENGKTMAIASEVADRTT